MQHLYSCNLTIIGAKKHHLLPNCRLAALPPCCHRCCCHGHHCPRRRCHRCRRHHYSQHRCCRRRHCLCHAAAAYCRRPTARIEQACTRKRSASAAHRAMGSEVSLRYMLITSSNAAVAAATACAAAVTVVVPQRGLSKLAHASARPQLLIRGKRGQWSRRGRRCTNHTEAKI